MTAIFDKNHIVAKPGFNRWLMPPVSVAIHLCIGSVYAWSIFNPALTKAVGVAVASADDWSLSDVVWIFSVAIVSLGLAAAFAGKWLEKVGPRVVGFVAACCWGGGFIIAGIGLWLHQLWLLYLGYGVIGGCGLGLGYVSPVSTLIKWFPDRRGMATGMAIMGFGGGAMIGAPLIEGLLRFFYRVPEYLGPVDGIDLVTRGGVRFLEIAGQWREVVVVNAQDAAAMIVPGDPGVYLVGTGSVGAMQTFFTLGVVYFIVMTIAAFSFRIPASDWSVPGWRAPSAAQAAKKMITRRHVDIDQALKTPQFYLLWIVLCFNVSAGIGVLGVAKTMIGEIFGTTLPGIVTAGFAATYVTMISLFNMVGRFFWASMSDIIGRKTTYFIFFSLGTVLYLSIPFTARAVSADPSVVWLVLFYGATMIIFTMYGGGFATIPAYLADIFGTRFVGGIHGRLLTAWSTAGVVGPLAITWLRDHSRMAAISDLSAKVDPAIFRATFGEGRDKLALLIEKNTVTISKLMEIVPPGTADPTSTLYNSTMFAMAGLLVIAMVANWRVRQVAEKHYIRD